MQARLVPVRASVDGQPRWCKGPLVVKVYFVDGQRREFTDAKMAHNAKGPFLVVRDMGTDGEALEIFESDHVLLAEVYEGAALIKIVFGDGGSTPPV